ncbi:MAG: glycosyltransferase, partial [Planctomycetota bacterium]|nr:glycosyltransferase [Planctomycetota bacterium]
MRIGFDCAPLVFPHSPGIRRVVENTLQALEKRGNMQVIRLMPDPEVELRHWRQKGLARWVQQEKLQGLHAFQSAFCRRARVPVVQTVHELSWRHGVHEAGAWKQKLWVWLGRRRAAAVVCATDFAARDYRAASRRGPRPTVIPWGLTHGFDAAPAKEDLARLEAWGLAGKQFVLSPGGLRKKKRPLELLSALLQIQPACTAHLVFTGP